jgi:threonine/homoserine/homoserine lactone efflux protein
LETLGSFILAALALAGSPGPNTLSLAAVGAAFGRRSGLGYMAGMTLGMLIVITIVGSGISALVFALPGVAPVVTVAAAAYFLYLAWRIATAPPIGAARADRGVPKWYEGTGLSLVNPKAYAAMAAMFSGFVLIDGAPFGDGLAKAAMLVGVIVFVNLCWLTAGAFLTRFFRDPRTSRIINVTFAVLLIASVIVAVLL